MSQEFKVVMEIMLLDEDGITQHIFERLNSIHHLQDVTYIDSSTIEFIIDCRAVTIGERLESEFLKIAWEEIGEYKEINLKFSEMYPEPVSEIWGDVDVYKDIMDLDPEPNKFEQHRERMASQ